MDDWLTIITPCIRFQNLHEISKTIPKGIRWIVVFDMNEMPNKKYIPKRAECYLLHTPERGYPQSNLGLDKVDSGWVYFLDDDTTLHSKLIPTIEKTIKENPELDFIHFDQSYINGVKRVGGMVKVKHIDKGNYIVRRDLIGNDRFKNCASADGMFAVILNEKSKHSSYLPKNLSIYNALRSIDESKYTIIIPTMWYYSEWLKQMVEIYDRSKWVTEILIINNFEEQRIDLPYNKVRVIGTGKNMFVNAAWNLAVEHSKSDKIIIANDDILVNETQLNQLFSILEKKLKPGMVIGPHSSCISKYKLPLDKRVHVQRGGKRMSAGSGIFMCMMKESYHKIPKQLPIWHGDLILFEINKYYVFKGVEIRTDMRGTTTKLMTFETEKGGRAKEREFYLQYKANGYKPFGEKIEDGSCLNVVLVFKTGGRFNLRDVMFLAYHLQKQKGSFNIKTFCLTDAIQEKMVMRNVTLLPMQYQWRGWWAKMNLFAPELEYLRPCMYIDLDTAVVKPLSLVLPAERMQNNVIMLRDFYKARQAASGLMWIPAQNDKISKIWETWIASPETHMRKHRGDQEFIRTVCTPDLYWQDIVKGVVSYKPEKKYRKELNGVENVVCFHGKPKIREAAKSVRWVREYVKEGGAL